MLFLFASTVLFSGAVPTNIAHRSTVEDADGIDGTICSGTVPTRPCNPRCSTVAGASIGSIDGTRPLWHSVFGLCTCSKMRRFLELRKQAVKHRRKVNGLIKLERNLWIADKADQLDAAFDSGNMHDMYKHLGAITKYAKNKTSSQKVYKTKLQ